ncbi:MAG: carbamoyl-phosphate synthase large subunit, partial [Nitrososphaerota archaeon]
MERISKVLVLGSGGIKIAEAAEFDYSGSQALKALKEEGIKTVLVNPNVATIQTSHTLADKVYLLPLTSDFVSRVIEKERPDGILIGFGGQSALSTGVELYRKGVLSEYSVKVLGTPIEGIEAALTRHIFRETMLQSGIPIPPSMPATTIDGALEAAEEIGYPVIVRVSFNLGGRGSFIARRRQDLESELSRAFSHSPVKSLLVERYLDRWKEIEYEIVRDRDGNSVAVACLENIEPMGVHTGESLVVAPSQTLTDTEYQSMRRASIKVAEAINLIGECNVQLALDQKSGMYYVIETNPRMSRSSALASKATGYPLAYVAAKLALGYLLDELINKVTGTTTAFFEPSLDYIVLKAPRWDLEKFWPVENVLNSEMKSVGEVMAIGRNLEEVYQKAFRMLDIGVTGVVTSKMFEDEEALDSILLRIENFRPYWLLDIAKAIIRGATVEDISSKTGVDPFFIRPVENIVKIGRRLINLKKLDEKQRRLILREAV